MQINKATTKSGNLSSILLLGIFITLIYSNTFKSAWQFDDFANIVQNPAVHIDNLSPSTLLNTFFHNRLEDPHMAGRIYRPIANLTLALNWFHGRDNVEGYHVINLIIHLINAFLLFFIIKTLLSTSRQQGKYHLRAHDIALLTAILWAANPIQTQAVTYIIQRMTSMAALFYLGGLCCFIQGRQATTKAKRFAWFFGCLTSYFFAVGSKENAALMPLAIGLIEIIFYQDLNQLKKNKRFIWATVLSGLIVFIIGFIMFAIFKGNPFDYFQRAYADRPFTLSQRLLTEPRVLILYLSQLFYPTPDRFSLVYDIEVSTGVFHPWTTLPAIGIVAGLIGISILQASKRPLLAFGILFFFLNHIIEATVFPLEIAFDHRNYLPSLFLFMAPVAGLVELISNYHNRNKPIALALSAATIFLIVMLGIGTYTRNMVWQTQRSLWQDVALKNPGLARPLQNLAGIYNQAGQPERALELYSRALSLNDPKPRRSHILSLNNIGNIYFKLGLYENAIQAFSKVLEMDDEYERARFNLALVLVTSNRLEEALQQAVILLEHDNGHPKFLNLKGHILIKLNRPQEALRCFRDALRSSPNNRNALLNLGVGYKDIGDHKKADWLLRWAAQLYSNDTMILLRLIENALLAENQSNVNRYVGRLLERKSVAAIERIIQRLPNETRLLPIDDNLLMQAIKAYIAQNIFINES